MPSSKKKIPLSFASRRSFRKKILLSIFNENFPKLFLCQHTFSLILCVSSDAALLCRELASIKKKSITGTLLCFNIYLQQIVIHSYYDDFKYFKYIEKKD